MSQFSIKQATTLCIFLLSAQFSSFNTVYAKTWCSQLNDRINWIRSHHVNRNGAWKNACGHCGPAVAAYNNAMNWYRSELRNWQNQCQQGKKQGYSYNTNWCQKSKDWFYSAKQQRNRAEMDKADNHVYRNCGYWPRWA